MLLPPTLPRASAARAVGDGGAAEHDLARIVSGSVAPGRRGGVLASNNSEDPAAGGPVQMAATNADCDRDVRRSEEQEERPEVHVVHVAGELCHSDMLFSKFKLKPRGLDWLSSQSPLGTCHVALSIN